MAEPTGARTRLVGEVDPRQILGQVAASGREVPVHEEERGQALLAVERLKCAVLLELAVDEVEADGLRMFPGDRTPEDPEEVAADLVDLLATAALGVVALDE